MYIHIMVYNHYNIYIYMYTHTYATRCPVHVHAGLRDPRLRDGPAVHPGRKQRHGYEALRQNT